jgi:carbonic anhydrase
MKQNELSRRALFRHACCGAFGLAGSLALLPARAEAQKKANLTPDQALARLKKGNVDFLADKTEVSPQDHNRRLEIGSVCR